MSFQEFMMSPGYVILSIIGCFVGWFIFSTLGKTIRSFANGDFKKIMIPFNNGHFGKRKELQADGSKHVYCGSCGKVITKEENGRFFITEIGNKKCESSWENLKSFDDLKKVLRKDN